MRKPWPARCNVTSCAGSHGVGSWTSPPRRTCARGGGPAAFRLTAPSVPRSTTERVLSGSFGTAPGGLSPWSGFTHLPASGASPRRRLAWSTGSPSPIGTATTSFGLRPLSCSTAWPGSYASFTIQPHALGPAPGPHLRGASAPEPIPELPSLCSGEPAGYLLCHSSRGSARTGSSSISPLPMTGRLEARPRPIRAPPARRTRPSPTAHRTILRAPIPMALPPPRLRLPSSASRAHGRPRHPRLFGTLHGQTPRPTLSPLLRGRLDVLLWGKPSRHTSATRRPLSF